MVKLAGTRNIRPIKQANMSLHELLLIAKGARHNHLPVCARREVHNLCSPGVSGQSLRNHDWNLSACCAHHSADKAACLQHRACSIAAKILLELTFRMFLGWFRRCNSAVKSIASTCMEPVRRSQALCVAYHLEH